MYLSQAIKEAKTSAPLVTICRAKGGADIVVYYKWHGEDSPESYFTDCPRDALETAQIMNRVQFEHEIAMLENRI